MRYTRIGDVPPQQVWVRKSFLRAGQDSFGEFEEAIIIGATIRKDMALTFTVLLESGAVWYELPLPAFKMWRGETKPPQETGVPLLDVCQMWDCLSDDFTIHRYDHLRYLTANVWLNGNAPDQLTPADYLFTIDFIGSFYADHPSEHKTYNVLATKVDGTLVAYPNNRILFEDKTFTKLNGRPKYIQTNKHFFAENKNG